MKTTTGMKVIIMLLLVACLSPTAQAQKEEIKALEEQYATFSKHKKFLEKDRWAMVRFHIYYKLTTAFTAKDVEKNKQVQAKVKTSSGSYGILQGISEQDLQDITDLVAANFIKRMKEDAGVEIITWGAFKDNPNAQKIVEKAGEDERELFSPSQGLGYAMSYDGTPVWNKVIQIVPGGKKLAKELDANVVNLSFYVDFAQTEADADAWISVGRSTTSTVAVPGGWAKETIVPYTLGESAEQRIVPGVRVLPKLGSQAVLEAATDIGYSGVTGHSELLHSFTFIYPWSPNPTRLISPIPYATEVKKFEGQIPEVLQNRRNNKIEYATTFEVHTTPERYGLAVLDATDQFFSDLINYYNLVKGK